MTYSRLLAWSIVTCSRLAVIPGWLKDSEYWTYQMTYTETPFQMYDHVALYQLDVNRHFTIHSPCEIYNLPH